MIFLLLYFISSTLRRGDDPYSILGVTRDATAQQIRTAFRKIAFDHHPDRHKGDEDSYRKWLRANDAYDILSDPQRKLRYDQDGTVSESDSNDNQQSQKQNTGGYYNYGNYGYRSSSSSSTSYHTPLMTEQLFPYLARDGNEWILFAFQHFDCPNCHDQQNIWEKFAYDIKDYVKVGRLDITQAPNLADELGITNVPQFLSVKLINKSKYEVHKLGSQFSSPTAAMNSLFKHWRASISRFSPTSSSFNDWLTNKDQSKVHVVEVRIETEKSETVHFKYAASKLRNSCVFASVTVKSENDARVNWNISFTKLPIVLVFRSNNQKLKPIVIDAKGRRIYDEIDELSSPLFPTLTATSIKRVCNDWCVVHIDREGDSKFSNYTFGSINESFIESAYNMPFNTGRMSVNSKIYSAFESSTFSEWIVISASKMKFWQVKLDKENEFVSLCSNLYRADDIEDALKKKKSFSIGKIPMGPGDAALLARDAFASLIEDESKRLYVVGGCLAVLLVFVCLMCRSKPKRVKKDLEVKKQQKVADKVENESKEKVDEVKNEVEKNGDEKVVEDSHTDTEKEEKEEGNDDIKDK
ncbi:hypothetical protein M9Y10_022569 [Tritrichomonas musculus]|uniref:J domain-containing protein n=1 Tax=Tritrichomonas musculus TaxID=1915356 RepID=A0ABR2KTK3_9EUKA